MDLVIKNLKKDRAWKWGISFIALLCLGLLAMTYYVGWSLTHPARIPIERKPDAYQLGYEEIEFANTSDGTLLKGWHIPAQDKERLIIFAHGYAKHRSHEEAALPTAKALHEKGIASLFFDFRNSGESEGSLTTVGYYEKSDLLSAVAYAKQMGYKAIGVIGYSMGGSTALVSASETADIRVVVADSPFRALRPYLEENLSVWSKLPDFPFTPIMMWQIEWITGVTPDGVNPMEAVKSMKNTPFLLIHSEGDPKVPIQNSLEILEVSQQGKAELWKTPGDVHVGSFEENPTIYLDKVVGFIVESLSSTEM
ncbi:alpha/beta hydrolase [Ammoniphilus sp. 3BR4]|uniref:alpha/beta hydrolase n=1 Tax=Ammoniphilus sp. 3BR4 TaxID=3158265 RepID=UPI0034662EB7